MPISLWLRSALLACTLPLSACGSPEGQAILGQLLGALAVDVLKAGAQATAGTGTPGSTPTLPPAASQGPGPSQAQVPGLPGGGQALPDGSPGGGLPGAGGTPSQGQALPGPAGGAGQPEAGEDTAPGPSGTGGASGPSTRPSLAPGLPSGLPSVAEDELLSLLRTYRRGKGLPDIPTSRSLMIVAQAHAADLEAHPPDRAAGCNMHSWSSFGPWKAVCYTSDHAQAEGMWRKPQELGTPYPGHGFEISYGMSGAQPSPQDALDGWISSPGHHAVVINAGSWKDNTWRAVGAGMKGGYAVMWFGEEADPAGAP